jgi:hypothetical protein
MAKAQLTHGKEPNHGKAKIQRPAKNLITAKLKYGARQRTIV